MSGVLMILGAAVCFGVTPTFAKISFDNGADSAGLLAARYVCASIVILGFLAIRRRLEPVGRKHSGVLILAGLFCVQGYTFFQSLQLTSTVITVLLLYTYPLLVTVGSAVFLGEHLDRSKAGILLIGVLGVCLTLGGVSGHVSGLGVALGLASGISFSVFLLLGKERLGGELDPIEMTGLIYAVSAVVFTVLLVLGDGSLPSNAEGWLALAGVVVIGTIASMTLFLSGLERLPAGVTSMLSTLEPAVSVGLAALVLGEGLSAIQVLGMCLVLGAIGALGYLLLRSEPPEPGDPLVHPGSVP